MSIFVSAPFHIVSLALYLFFISGPLWISYRLLARNVKKHTAYNYQIFAVSVCVTNCCGLPITLCLWLDIGNQLLLISTLSSLVFLMICLDLDKKRTVNYLAKFFRAVALREKIKPVFKLKWPEVRSQLNANFIFVGVSWVVLLALLLAAIFMFDALPYENDSVQYLIAANLFLEHGTIDIYPFSQATREFDFYAVSSHPISLFQFSFYSNNWQSYFHFFHRKTYLFNYFTFILYFQFCYSYTVRVDIICLVWLERCFY